MCVCANKHTHAGKHAHSHKHKNTNTLTQTKTHENTNTRVAPSFSNSTATRSLGGPLLFRSGLSLTGPFSCYVPFQFVRASFDCYLSKVPTILLPGTQCFRVRSSKSAGRATRSPARRHATPFADCVFTPEAPIQHILCIKVSFLLRRPCLRSSYHRHLYFFEFEFFPALYP